MQFLNDFPKFFFYLCVILLSFGVHADEDVLILRDNLKKAQKGDFIVTFINKNLTLLHIYNKDNDYLMIEEITVAENKKVSQACSWKEWVSEGAPGHSSWIMYDIDLKDGQIRKIYSFTKQSWMKTANADNFFSQLLNLRFSKVPDEKRKRVGRGPNRESRPLWQPQMIVNGYYVQGVHFDSWKTQWPKDGSDLSGKWIEVYLPQDDDKYPGYFPYWLEISGLVGKARVRIIDSGHGMKSTKPSIEAIAQ